MRCVRPVLGCCQQVLEQSLVVAGNFLYWLKADLQSPEIEVRLLRAGNAWCRGARLAGLERVTRETPPGRAVTILAGILAIAGG